MDESRRDPQADPMPRWAIGLFAALPLIGLQGIYLTDISDWDTWFVYGGFIIVLIILAIGFAAGFGIEIYLRRKLNQSAQQFPWLSLTALVSLLILPAAVWLAKPLVSQVPTWNRVYQIIEWESSRPHATYAGNESFVLVFNAQGNIASHTFNSAYLNWSGDEAAGFSGIDLERRTFNDWVDGKCVETEMTRDTLNENIAMSNLPEAEADRIADDIWHVLELASQDEPIAATSGRVGAIHQDPFDHEDIKLGSVAWMALLALACVGVAKVSLPGPGWIEES